MRGADPPDSSDLACSAAVESRDGEVGSGPHAHGIGRPFGARDELTDPERKLWDAAQTGATVDLRTGDSERDDPTTGDTWDTGRQIRAELLSELLTMAGGLTDSRPRPLRLAGARVTGTLDLEAATLTYPVLLIGCFFDEPITLTEASTHALRFPGCHVPGLIAKQLRTGGNLELNSGFAADDGVVLSGAHIGGQLSFEDATLTNPNGTALDTDGLTVDQNMYCQSGFRAEGEVNLGGAHIGGQLSFEDATLTNPNGITLQLEELHAKALILRPKARPEGLINITHAQVGVFLDDEATWPTTLILRGFVYDSLYERSQISAAARLRWLDRDPNGYTPQPYEQLVGAYRRAGRDDDARKVAIAKQLRRRETLNWPGKVWNSLLRWTVGYGYRTGRLACGCLG